MNNNNRNFKIKLIERRRVINANGQAKDFYIFLIEIGGNEIVSEVPENQVSSFSWVEEATHGVARYCSKKGIETLFYQLVHDTIDDQICEVPFKIFYEQNGWKKFPEGWSYVEGNGVIGNRRTNIFGNPKLRLQCYAGMTELECCRQFLGMEKIFKNPNLSRFLMVFVCASIMGTLYEEKGMPLQFVLALLGTTNTMKTTTAKVFTQFYNAQDTKKPSVTFASTKGGIETFVDKYSDAILLIDDFMPADDDMEMREMSAKLKSIIRLYGDRVAKSRMSANPTQRRAVNEVRGTCVITAEILPGIKSSQTRVISLELPKNGVNTEWLTYYQKNPLLLPTFLRGFIGYIARDCDTIMRRMSGFFELYRKSAGFSVPRYCDVAAQMRVALDLLCDYFKFVGLDDAMRLEWTESLYSIIRENDRKLQGTDYAVILAEALVDGIMKRRGTKDIDEIGDWGGKEVYEDQNYYYITLNLMYEIYIEYCKSYKIAHYFKKEDIIKKLIENEMLDTIIDERGFVQASRKLCQGKGNFRRFLYIKKKKIQELCGKGDQI